MCRRLLVFYLRLPETESFTFSALTPILNVGPTPSSSIAISAVASIYLYCFDGFAVTWSIDTNAEFVNSMLDNGISVLEDGEKPIIHSDRGCHYRWPGWIGRMDTAGLTCSMSKKACSPDNAACEGFFGCLKNEMFYYKSWMGVSIEVFAEELDNTYVGTIKNVSKSRSDG